MIKQVITADGRYAYDDADASDCARVTALTGVEVEYVPAEPVHTTAELVVLATVRTPTLTASFDPEDVSDVKRVARLTGIAVEELSALKVGESISRDTEPPLSLTPPPAPLAVAITQETS